MDISHGYFMVKFHLGADKDLYKSVLDNQNIICWNIRGTMNVKGKRTFRELVKLHKPFIFIVLETHCSFSSVTSFWSNLNYKLRHNVEARNHARGIWILVEKNSQISMVESFFPSSSYNLNQSRLQGVDMHNYVCKS
uniref:Uncharacterized protein n=1 Tax=Cajanus cajan TaxID=3821 RepID=A0A151QLL2_CAJCA|nr:hypothetical protein KK1_048750 [Cajanus cajan]